MSTIKERVQAGAELLDKALPDWWNGKETPTIDLEILEMDSSKVCVLGQCFDGYEKGCDELGISAWSKYNKVSEAIAFGFLGVRLNTPWRQEIRRRRRNAKRRVK